MTRIVEEIDPDTVDTADTIGIDDEEATDQPTFLTAGDPVADLPMFITTTRNYELSGRALDDAGAPFL